MISQYKYYWLMRNLVQYPTFSVLNTQFIRYISEQSAHCEAIITDKSVFRSELENADDYTTSDWQTLKSKLINKDYRLQGVHVTENNVDGVVMSFCLKWNLTKVGRNFYKYLECENKNIHSSILSKYLKLCASNYESNVKENKVDMLKLFGELKKVSGLDTTTKENYIFALSLFEEHWKKGLDLLEDIKKINTPNTHTYSPLISAAFKFGDIQLGWNLWTELVHADKQAMPFCFLSYFENCRNLIESGTFSISQLEDLLHFCETHELTFPNIESVHGLQQLVEVINNKLYMANSVLISRIHKSSGVCNGCGQTLKSPSITMEQFSQLKTTFFERAIVGSNAYLKTNPAELKRFDMFLNQIGPYHIVVDGLNVALKTRIRNPAHQANKVLSVVQYLKSKSWKIVLLGRKHMKSWPQQQMNFIYKNASVFLADNISQDDPFLLYAALHGGPNTYFVSDDFMRGHKFLLKDRQLQALFKRWQMSHQYRINYASPMGNADIVEPLSFLPAAQSNSSSNHVYWHVPYRTVYMDTPPASLEPPEDWICIKLDNRSTSS